MKICQVKTGFRDIALFSFVEFDGRFRVECCLCHHGYSSIIALMMEAVHASETSVYFETTRRYIPEECNVYTSRHQNMKCHLSAGLKTEGGNARARAHPDSVVIS